VARELAAGGYYGSTEKLDAGWIFNIRQDPFESYDQAPGPRAAITQSHTTSNTC